MNRENYEAWLLDLMEGRLSTEQAQRLRDFLLLNPDCASGMDEPDAWVLESDHISYKRKADLKKVIPVPEAKVTERHFDLFSIARLEGDLSDQQEKDYLSLLESDEKKMEDWGAWKETKLVGAFIPYGKKKNLKRRTNRGSGIVWISLAAAAALVVLFFTLFRVDQEYALPGEMLTQEALENPGIIEEPEIVLDESFRSPDLLADDPVILSIKKHQDPPELTGMKSDTIGRKVRQEDLQPRPVKLSMLDKDLMKQADRGSYDRIELFEIPPIPDYSQPSAFEKFSEKSLRASYRDFIRDRDISFLSVASAGIEGINNLAGSDLKLNVSHNEEGEATGFRFRSSLLSVDSPIKKRKNRESVQPGPR